MIKVSHKPFLFMSSNYPLLFLYWFVSGFGFKLLGSPWLYLIGIIVSSGLFITMILSRLSYEKPVRIGFILFSIFVGVMDLWTTAYASKFDLGIFMMKEANPFMRALIDFQAPAMSVVYLIINKLYLHVMFALSANFLDRKYWMSYGIELKAIEDYEKSQFKRYRWSLRCLRESLRVLSDVERRKASVDFIFLSTYDSMHNFFILSTLFTVVVFNNCLVIISGLYPIHYAAWQDIFVILCIVSFSLFFKIGAYAKTKKELCGFAQ